jgi:DNA topoisomerase-3
MKIKNNYFLKMFRKTTSLLAQKMLKALNVAEKPSVAKTIRDILSEGNFTMPKSYSKYNPIFQFKQKSKDKEYDFTVTSIRGHMIDYCIPEKLKIWDMNSIGEIYDTTLQRKVMEGCESLAKNLEEYGRYNNNKIEMRMY